MTDKKQPVSVLGTDSDAATLEAAGFRVERVTDWPAIGADDILVVSVDSPEIAPGLHGRSAYTACLAARRQNPRGRVFFAADASIEQSESLARFCLANGVLARQEDGSLAGLDALREPARPTPPVSIDALLERLERDIEARGEQATRRAIERLQNPPAEGQLLRELTDAETGLFDGPFALFKLDEELKRAQRFHHPLTILLVDCGVADWGPSRALALAEVAAVFLEECRDIDVVARFDVSTFLFLLPGTPPDGARALADRLAKVFRTREFSGGVRVRASIGLGSAPAAGIRTGRDLLAAAEETLLHRSDDSA